MLLFKQVVEICFNMLVFDKVEQDIPNTTQPITISDRLGLCQQCLLKNQEC